jgi:hypothetical protein
MANTVACPSVEDTINQGHERFSNQFTAFYGFSLQIFMFTQRIKQQISITLYPDRNTLPWDKTAILFIIYSSLVLYLTLFKLRGLCRVEW